MGIEESSYRPFFQGRRQLSLSFLLLGLAHLMGACEGERSKVGYVRLSELFQEFRMKKELERRLPDRKGEGLMDSLRAGKDLDPSAERRLQNAISGEEHRSNGRREQKVRWMSRRIWKRLDQYIKEFGKDRGYARILGAKGEGGLLYGSPEDDITQEVLEYANARYNDERDAP